MVDVYDNPEHNIESQLRGIWPENREKYKICLNTFNYCWQENRHFENWNLRRSIFDPQTFQIWYYRGTWRFERSWFMFVPAQIKGWDKVIEKFWEFMVQTFCTRLTLFCAMVISRLLTWSEWFKFVPCLFQLSTNLVFHTFSIFCSVYAIFWSSDPSTDQCENSNTWRNLMNFQYWRGSWVTFAKGVRWRGETLPF